MHWLICCGSYIDNIFLDDTEEEEQAEDENDDAYDSEDEDYAYDSEDWYYNEDEENVGAVGGLKMSNKAKAIRIPAMSQLQEPVQQQQLKESPFTGMLVPPMQAVLSPSMLKQHKKTLKKGKTNAINPGMLDIGPDFF